MDATTLTITIVGLLTTLVAGVGGPLLHTRSAARYEERARMHADRVTLYVDAMIYVHNTTEYLDYLTGDVLNRPAFTEGLAGRDEITGRMWLLAPSQILGPWLSLMAAQREIAYNLTEEWDIAPGFNRPMPSRTEPSVAQALTATVNLRGALRDSTEAGSAT
jgi:hypothetical protein